jgi:hypothetical protein
MKIRKRTRNAIGGVLLAIIILLVLFFATPLFGTGPSAEVSLGGATDGGGFPKIQGAYIAP